MPNLLEFALKYSELGFSVVPCLPPTKDSEGKDQKRPRIAWTEYQTRKATADEIIAWWGRHPDSRIGIVTGSVSNLLVIDCDNEEAHDKMESELLPDGVITPKAKSPHGWHYYFRHVEGIGNATRIAGLSIDCRAEGGFIMAPPNGSINGAGYAWVEGLDPWACQEIAMVPDSILSLLSPYTPLSSYNTSLSLSNSNIKSTGNIGSSIASGVPGKGLNFNAGGRDETLFHVANCLVKGGMPQNEIAQLLELLAINVCNPPFNPKDATIKVKSALDREKKVDRNLTEEVREWVMSTDVHFVSTDVHKELGLSTRVHKKNVSTILTRLAGEGIIEKTGNKNGQWRKIDRNFVEQTWWKDDGQSLPVRFPLEVQEFAKVHNGNIVLLEGQKSQGKSAFALEFCRLNRALFPGKVLYQNVEMADSELLERFRAYGDVMSPDEWRQSVTFIKQTSEWWDKIQPDGLNVIDYFVEYKEPYLLAQYVWNVHQKLKQGIALIVVQRDPYKPYPSGGRAVRDIPRVIVSLIKHKLRIEDIKSWHQTVYGNPNGLTRKYKQVSWWNFKPESGWEFEEEEKYAAFKH